MNPEIFQSRQRLTQKQKNANDKQWYKDWANRLDTISLNNNSFLGYGEVSEFRRMKANYDLFNNIINIRDFAYVCQPFGADVGDLPANFVNRDIVSSKIKVLLGMEQSMPFDWSVVAINEEASTRKVDVAFDKIRDFVVSSITQPIKTQVQKEQMEKVKGKQLTPEEQQQLQANIEAEVQSKTPDSVTKYMQREHQDPAEALAEQLLEYLIPTKRIEHKFNKGWKHATLSGKELYWVGQINGEPDVKVVNSLYFDCDMSPDTDFVEDGEWAVYEMRMSPTQVISEFGSVLTDDQIDKIYQFSSDPTRVADSDFTFTQDSNNQPYTVRVLHANWKALRLVQFLTYQDNNGKVQEIIVDENYKLDKEHGDIKLTREWIPEAHECYKILDDIFVLARPVPGQEVDLDNLWECKLSYYGACIDNMNSPLTAPMDRMKTYQYLYNIILYRIELLMASDKGKILAGNINKIPKSSGINIDKFLYFMEANKVAWFNPQEEGNKLQQDSASSVFSVLDMSLVSDIQKYMQLAEYVEKKCGLPIGVTPQMEAQIAANEAVTNTKQNMVQSSYIMKPYFQLHNTVKGNVLNALVNCARSAYSTKQPTKLSYVLDDMSMKMLTLDPKLLQESKYKLQVANSAKAEEAKRMVEQLSQAALQNQQADLSDIIKIIKSNSVNEAEELLEAAQARKADQEQASAKAQQDSQDRTNKAMQDQQERQWEHDEKMIVLKETERRKTEVQKQEIQSFGFDTNKDEDNDGTPDVLEVAKYGVDASIKNRKMALDENKFAHQQVIDKGKLKNEEERNKIMKQKSTKLGSK